MAAMLVEAAMELWDVIQAGIAIGNIDIDEGGFASLVQAAHGTAWDDLESNPNLNSGQVTMCGMARDAGSEALEDVTMETFSMDAYISAMMNSSEGARNAISQSISYAAMSVSTAANEAVTGLVDWAAEFFDGPL